jgi:hypothetical protein
MKRHLQGHPDSSRSGAGFRQQAEQKPKSFAAEFLDFILHNKKWWLLPIVFVLLLFGCIAFLGGTGAAPFLYTLF